MMSTRHQIDQLLEKTIGDTVSCAAVERELRILLDAFDDEIYRIKIHNAIQWVKIQSVSAQSERYGNPQKVRGWLIQDLRAAANRAGDLQGKDLRESRQRTAAHNPAFV